MYIYTYMRVCMYVCMYIYHHIYIAHPLYPCCCIIICCCMSCCCCSIIICCCCGVKLPIRCEFIPIPGCPAKPPGAQLPPVQTGATRVNRGLGLGRSGVNPRMSSTRLPARCSTRTTPPPAHTTTR